MDFSPQQPLPSWPPATPMTAKRSRRFPWWVLIVILVLALLGGGYYAYSAGYVSLPFLKPTTKTLLQKVGEAMSSITSAEYRVGIRAVVEPRESGATTFLSNASEDSAEELPVVQNPSDVFRQLPLDLDLTSTLTAFVQTNVAGADAHASIHVEADYAGGGIETRTDIELRKIAQDFYVLVKDFPGFPFLELRKIQDQWVHITPDDDTTGSLDTWTNSSDDVASAADLRMALEVAVGQGLITIGNEIATEEIQGFSSKHYRPVIDPSKLVSTYEEIARRKTEAGRATDLEDALLGFLEDPDYYSSVEGFFRNTSFDIWVEESTGYLRQVRMRVALVPPEDVMAFQESQISFELTATLTKINEPVVVLPPTNAINAAEATERIIGIDPALLGNLNLSIDPLTNMSSNTNTEITNTNAAVNTNVDTVNVNAAANTNVALQPVAFQAISSSFSGAVATFRFAINDAAGVDAITVRGFGRDWDPFENIHGDSDAQLVSGSIKNGTWELKAVKHYGQSLTSATATRGWYVVWRRKDPTDGVDFYHGGNNGSTYQEFTDVQRDTVPFNTISSGIPADGDADGLADEVEPLYGTDANNPDTDGDGYSDGVEVGNGYDPNGPGTL